MPTVPIWVSNSQMDELDKRAKELGLNRYKTAKLALEKFLNNKEEKQPESTGDRGAEGRGQETVKVSY